MGRQTIRTLHQLIAAKTEEKSQPISLHFLNDLIYHIEEEEKENKKEPSPSFKPSSMKCVRNMYYQITRTPVEKDDISYNLVGICESGSDRHIRLQTHISNMKTRGIDCEYIDVEEFVKSRNLTNLDIVSKEGMETKLYNKKYNISFMCDGIIRYKGIYYILEIKTETDLKFRNRVNFNEDHTAQICAYKLSFGISDVIMLYEDRDNCQLKCYYINVTDEMVFDNVISRIEEVNTAVDTLTIPRAEIGKNCKYCAYSKRCKKDGI